MPSRAAVVTALGITQILGFGSTYYLPAVLGAPIAADTGWPLSWVIGGLSLALFVSGAVSPRIGRIIDARGGRPVLMASALLTATGQAGLALAPTLALHLAAWVLIGLGMGAGLYDACFATLVRRYGAAARGTITAVTMWGGFASTVCWPLSALLVAAVGWRGACLAYAAIQLAVVLPLHAFLVPREEARAPPPVPRPAECPGPDGAPAPRHAAAVFALLTACFTLGGVISTIVSVHLIAMLQARDVALAAAVGLGALIGPAQVGGRLFELLLGRRFHPLWTMQAAAALTALGILVMAAGGAVVAAGLVLYGAGVGVTSIARGTLPLALFGPRGYATMIGRLAMPSLITQSLSPALGALLLEQAGAAGAFATLAAAAAVNVALVAALWPLARAPRA